MMHTLKTVALKLKNKKLNENTDFFKGVTRLYKIKNEVICKAVFVRPLHDKLRELRLRWFGYVQRRQKDYVGRRMLQTWLPDKRSRGRLK